MSMASATELNLKEALIRKSYNTNQQESILDNIVFLDGLLRKILLKKSSNRTYDDLLTIKARLLRMDNVKCLFKSLLPPEQIDELCRSLQFEKININDVIFSQGDVATKFYIGSCEILLKPKLTLEVDENLLRNTADYSNWVTMEEYLSLEECSYYTSNSKNNEQKHSHLPPTKSRKNSIHSPSTKPKRNSITSPDRNKSRANSIVTNKSSRSTTTTHQNIVHPAVTEEFSLSSSLSSKIANHDHNHSHHAALLTTIKVGDFFGERALQTDLRCQVVTVKATEPTELLTLSRDVYFNIVDNSTATSAAGTITGIEETSDGKDNSPLHNSPPIARSLSCLDLLEPSTNIPLTQIPAKKKTPLKVEYQRLSSRIHKIFLKHCEDRSDSELRVALGYLNEKVMFLKRFSIQHRLQICQQVTLVRFPPKTILFNQEDVAQGFYIIYSGTVLVTVAGKDIRGKDAVLKSHLLEEGKAFGEKAFENENTLRTATVETGTEGSELLVLSRDSYLSLIHQLKVEELTRKVALLSKCYSFAKLTQSQREEIARFLEPKIYRVGVQIYQEGQLASDIFIIHRGDCRVSRRMLSKKLITTSTPSLGLTSPNHRKSKPGNKITSRSSTAALPITTSIGLKQLAPHNPHIRKPEYYGEGGRLRSRLQSAGETQSEEDMGRLGPAAALGLYVTACNDFNDPVYYRETVTADTIVEAYVLSKYDFFTRLWPELRSNIITEVNNSNAPLTRLWDQIPVFMSADEIRARNAWSLFKSEVMHHGDLYRDILDIYKKSEISNRELEDGTEAYTSRNVPMDSPPKPIPTGRPQTAAAALASPALSPSKSAMKASSPDANTKRHPPSHSLSQPPAAPGSSPPHRSPLLRFESGRLSVTGRASTAPNYVSGDTGNRRHIAVTSCGNNATSPLGRRPPSPSPPPTACCNTAYGVGAHTGTSTTSGNIIVDTERTKAMQSLDINVRKSIAAVSSTQRLPFSLMEIRRDKETQWGDTIPKDLRCSVRICGMFRSCGSAKAAADALLLSLAVKLKGPLGEDSPPAADTTSSSSSSNSSIEPIPPLVIHWRSFQSYDLLPFEVNTHFIIMCRCASIETGSLQLPPATRSIPYPLACKPQNQLFACMGARLPLPPQKSFLNTSIPFLNPENIELLSLEPAQPLILSELSSLKDVQAVSATRLECLEFAGMFGRPPLNGELLVVPLFTWLYLSPDYLQQFSIRNDLSRMKSATSLRLTGGNPVSAESVENIPVVVPVAQDDSLNALNETSSPTTMQIEKTGLDERPPDVCLPDTPEMQLLRKSQSDTSGLQLVDNKLTQSKLLKAVARESARKVPPQPIHHIRFANSYRSAGSGYHTSEDRITTDREKREKVKEKHNTKEKEREKDVEKEPEITLLSLFCRKPNSANSRREVDPEVHIAALKKVAASHQKVVEMSNALCQQESLFRELPHRIEAARSELKYSHFNHEGSQVAARKADEIIHKLSGGVMTLKRSAGGLAGEDRGGGDSHRADDALLEKVISSRIATNRMQLLTALGELPLPSAASAPAQSVGSGAGTRRLSRLGSAELHTLTRSNSIINQNQPRHSSISKGQNSSNTSSLPPLQNKLDILNQILLNEQDNQVAQQAEM